MKTNSIIWALDPHQSAKSSEQLIKEMRLWAKILNCEVQPVTVFPLSEIKPSLELPVPWQGDIKKSLKEMVDTFIKRTKTKDFLDPEVLFVPGLSNRRLAAELSKVALKANAKMIFANTRAKKTWNPFRMGGFAETLLATSKTPVLLMNSKAKASRGHKSILFPTDLSTESKNALERLSPLAQALEGSIHLLHRVQNPAPYFTTMEGMVYLNTPEFYKELGEDLLKARSKRLDVIERKLGADGVSAIVSVRPERKSISLEILEYANREKCDLISMVNHSGPLAQALIGSIPRDVLLGAKCPVLMFYKPKPISSRNKKQLEKRKPNLLPLNEDGLVHA